MLLLFSFFFLNARIQWHFTALVLPWCALVCFVVCYVLLPPRRLRRNKDACTAFKDRTQTSQELCSYKDDVWILFLINKFISPTNRCKGIQYLKNVNVGERHKVAAKRAKAARCATLFSFEFSNTKWKDGAVAQVIDVSGYEQTLK